jgi:polyisoprenoid-binding protein YceI
MKRSQWLFLLGCLLLISATTTTAQAQSYRLNSLAEQLRTQANDLGIGKVRMKIKRYLD